MKLKVKRPIASWDDFEAGYQLCYEHMTRYVHPARQELVELNAIASIIWGVVLAEQNNQMLREQFKVFAPAMGGQMARVLTAYADASANVFGFMILPEPDLSHATAIFEAMKSFLGNPNDSGEALRQLLATGRPHFQSQLEVRNTFKRGRPAAEVMQRLDSEALRLFESEKITTYQKVVNRLATNEEFKPIIDEWLNAEDTLKERLKRYRKRLKGGGKTIMYPP
jgi:hypothetical protein